MFFKKKKATLRDDLQTVLDNNKIRGENKAKNHLNDLLKDDETPVYAMKCKKTQFGVLLVTDQRVIFASHIAGMPDLFTVNRENITGLESETSTMNIVTFKINQSGQQTVFGGSTKKDVAELIKRINN